MIIVPEAFWDEVPLMEPAGAGDITNSIDLTADPIWSQVIWNSTFTDPEGEDAEVWTKGEANVDELRAALADHAGETVVVGIHFGCGHLGEAETGMFDNFVFTGGALAAVRSDGKLTTLWGAVKAEF